MLRQGMREGGRERRAPHSAQLNNLDVSLITRNSPKKRGIAQDFFSSQDAPLHTKCHQGMYGCVNLTFSVPPGDIISAHDSQKLVLVCNILFTR